MDEGVRVCQMGPHNVRTLKTYQPDQNKRHSEDRDDCPHRFCTLIFFEKISFLHGLLLSNTVFWNGTREVRSELDGCEFPEKVALERLISASSLLAHNVLAAPRNDIESLDKQ